MKNAMELKSLNGKEVTAVAYAANRTDEVPGVISISGSEAIDTIPEETAKLLARRLLGTEMEVFPVYYGRTGVYDAEKGYRFDIRFRKSMCPTHWLCIARRSMKDLGGLLEVDHMEISDGVYAIVIPIAKAMNIVDGRLAVGRDPLLV